MPLQPSVPETRPLWKVSSPLPAGLRSTQRPVNCRLGSEDSDPSASDEVASGRPGGGRGGGDSGEAHCGDDRGRAGEDPAGESGMSGGVCRGVCHCSCHSSWRSETVDAGHGMPV